MENNRDQIRTIAAVRADRDIHKMPLKESQLMAVQLLNHGIRHREPSEDQGEYAYELRVNQIILQRLLSIKINAHYDSESDKELVLEDIASKTAYIKRYLSYQIDGYSPDTHPPLMTKPGTRKTTRIQPQWYTALTDDVLRPLFSELGARPNPSEIFDRIEYLIQQDHPIFEEIIKDKGTASLFVKGRKEPLAHHTFQNRVSIICRNLMDQK